MKYGAHTQLLAIGRASQREKRAIANTAVVNSNALQNSQWCISDETVRFAQFERKISPN
jgi:hypothetical protein